MAERVLHARRDLPGTFPVRLGERADPLEDLPLVGGQGGGDGTRARQALAHRDRAGLYVGAGEGCHQRLVFRAVERGQERACRRGGAETIGVRRADFARVQPPAQGIGQCAGGLAMRLAGRASEGLGQSGDVPRAHQPRRLDAEHGVRELHRALPVLRVRQRLRFQHEAVVELLDGRTRRLAAEGEAQPFLQRERQDHEVLHLAVETATFRRLDPGPQIARAQGVAAMLRTLAIQLVQPSPAELEVQLPHLPELERPGDVPHVVARAPVHLHPFLGMGHRPLHDLQHAAQRRAPDLDPELGVIRVTRRQCLAEDVLERLVEARRHRWPQLDARIQGDEMPLEIVAVVDGAGVGPGDAIRGEQAVADPRPHLVALVGHQAAGLVPVGLRKVRPVLVEAVAGQHLIEQHQPPEIVPGRVGEEPRQPDDGIDRLSPGDEVPHLRQIVERRVSGLVEGPVDHDSPPALGAVEFLRLHLPHVAEQDLAGAPGAPPRHPVDLRQPVLGLVEAQALVDELAHLLDPVPVIVQRLRVLEDALGVHPHDPERDHRVGGVVRDLDLPCLRCPLPALAEHDPALLARDRGAHGTVVERRQTRRGERPQRLDPLGERREQQRLHQPVVVAEARRLAGFDVAGLDVGGGHAVLALQQRQELRAVELPRVVEAQPHRLRERLVPLGDDVEQIADGDEVAEPEATALLDEKLQHELEGGALTLEERGDGDQGLHERGRERIDLPEHRAVAVPGEQGGQHLLAYPRGLLEGGRELRPRRLVLRAQHAPLHDVRQVAVFEGDGVEARLPPVEHVGEAELPGAGQMLPDQLAQIPLARDEAHDRDRPVGLHGLHELRDLLSFARDERGIRRMARQPQDQLVQEQDQGVVAERPRVPGHDAQPFVEGNEALAVRRIDATGGAEEGVDQVAHQAQAFVVAGRCIQRRIEAGRVPAAPERAPSAAAVPAVPDRVVQRPEEQIVAHPVAQVAGVREQAFRLVEPGGRRLRMPGADVLGIVPEDRRLHARRADHVVGDDQEAPAGGPCVGPGDGAGELGDRAGARVAAQQQRQHRHEVALAAAEAAVQVRALAGVRSDRAADQRQRVIEAARELRRHHVVAQRLLGPLHPLRQPQHEIALMDALGEIEDVGDGGHGIGAPVGGERHGERTANPSRTCPIRFFTGSVRPCRPVPDRFPLWRG